MTCVVFLLPAVYESSATLLIEQMSMPAELTGGAGAQDYVEQRLQRTRQRVLTDENVKSLIDRYGLYRIGLRIEQLEDKLADIQRKRSDHAASHRRHRPAIDARGRADLRIRCRVPAFRPGNGPEDRERTRESVRLLERGPGEGGRRARDRVRQGRIGAACVRIARARGPADRIPAGPPERPAGRPRAQPGTRDAVRARPRDGRFGPASGTGAPGAVRRRSCATRRATARSSTKPASSSCAAPTGLRRRSRNSSPHVSKYSENHPGREAAAARDRDQLTSEVSGELDERTDQSRVYPAPVAGQCGGNRSSRALGAAATRFRRNLRAPKAPITLSPRLEEQYTDLVRDYEVIKTQYEQMRAQQATAELQSKVAGSAAAETYVLINPARVPEDPVQPDRLALMFLGIVLAIAAGFGTAFLLNAADSTIRGSCGRRRAGRRGAFRACSGDPQPDRTAPPTHHGPCAGGRHGHDRPGPADLRRLSAGRPAAGRSPATHTHAIEVGCPARRAQGLA